LPEFCIRGISFDISIHNLERTAANMQTLPMNKITHTVEIGGKIFPIRQLLAEITGLSIKEISPLDAYRILEKLGYSIQYHR